MIQTFTPADRIDREGLGVFHVSGYVMVIVIVKMAMMKALSFMAVVSIYLSQGPTLGILCFKFLMSLV